MNVTLMVLPTDSLRIVSPFKDLMHYDKKVIGRIAESMKKMGYDTAWPISVWAGHDNTVVDGHLRLAAARLAGLKNVLVAECEFKTEEDACLYSLHHNVFRGHYSDAKLDKIFECASYAALENRLKHLLMNFHSMTVEVVL